MKIKEVLSKTIPTPIKIMESYIDEYGAWREELKCKLISDCFKRLPKPLLNVKVAYMSVEGRYLVIRFRSNDLITNK